MTAATLDTLAVVKQLKAAGFTDDQAEAVTKVVREAQDVALANLVTRADLKSELAAFKAELKAELAETKSEIIKWMFGTIGFQTLAILGAVLAFARLTAR